MVKERDETEVAKELATSLAPMSSRVRYVFLFGILRPREGYTNVPGIEEGKHSGQGKDVVILMKGGRHARSGERIGGLWRRIGEEVETVQLQLCAKAPKG
jgi:hypothetical protein